MLFYYHNEITFNCQYYRTENITNHPNPHCHTRVTSLRTARDFSCPHCHSRMYSYGFFLYSSRIFQIVSYAWAGFGACFGATILLSLYWKRMTLKGAYAGVLIGGITVLIWKQFEWFGIYELVPGFFLSTISIIVVSLLDKEPSESILKTFEKAISLSKKHK